jgi:hypothetical protein
VTVGPGNDVEVASRLSGSLRNEDVAVIQWWAERVTEREIEEKQGQRRTLDV